VGDECGLGDREEVVVARVGPQVPDHRSPVARGSHRTRVRRAMGIAGSSPGVAEKRCRRRSHRRVMALLVAGLQPTRDPVAGTPSRCV
jgi:hypothetical protein